MYEEDVIELDMYNTRQQHQSVSVPNPGTGQSGEAAIGEVVLIIFWVKTKRCGHTWPG